MSEGAPRPTVAIEVLQPCAAWAVALPGAAALCERSAGAALAALGVGRPGMELCIMLADDALLRRLNRAWRGKDTATNVLAFPAQAFARGRLAGAVAAAAAPLPLGDVAVALTTIAREAAEQGKSLADHLAHLVVHGVLHLLGFDHEAAPAAAAMEALEQDILAGLGVADPYATGPAPAEAAHG